MERIPFKPTDDLAMLLGPAAVVLLLLTVAAVIAFMLARRRGDAFSGPRQARRLKVLERLWLSRRAALWLVEVDGRTLVVGECGERLSRLDGPAAQGKP